MTNRSFVQGTRRLSLALSVCAAAAIGVAPALAQQPPDQAQLLQMLMQRMQGAQPGETPFAMPMQQQQAVRPSAPQVSEAQLAAQLAAWADAKGPFATESFRDGFSIQGERMLDPEGAILKFAVDASTGDAAYLAEIGANQYALKLMRYRTGNPVTIGTATRQQGVWSMETVSGIRAAGTRMNLSPRGFSIARDNALFSYQAGAGLKSFGLPEAFVLASHQNGDIEATKWLLLEKRAENKAIEGGVLGGTSLGEMVSLVKQLGAVVGVNKSDADFALYNIATREVVPIHISLEEKQANFLSKCRQRNKWVAQCEQLETRASLYGQDGAPNRQHYFWRLAWFQTPRGPIALTMEDSIGKIEAIELASGQRVTVFSRALGIAGWSASQQPDGRVMVTAQLGLDRQRVDDVAKLFEPRVVVQEASTSRSQTPQ